MLDLSPLPIAAGLIGMGAPELIVVVVVLGIFIPIPIVVAALYFRHQQQKLWHETARLALEKGQPLPPRSAEETGGRSIAHDLRSGLILIGLGIGLYFFLGRGIAFIVGFIGVALVLYAALIAIFAKDKNPPQDPPARS